MNSNNSNKWNWNLIGAQAIAWTMLTYCITTSTEHIIKAALKFEVHGDLFGITDFAAITSPILVDAVFFLGKLMMSGKLSAEANKAGKRLMIFGGAMSLFCNVAAADSWGGRGHGVLVVVVLILVEHNVGKIKAGPTKRQKGAAKAAATRKANAQIGMAVLGSVAAPATSKGGARPCVVGCTCKRHNRKAA